jgi:hypothetical protein
MGRVLADNKHDYAAIAAPVISAQVAKAVLSAYTPSDDLATGRRFGGV